ncbi:MAG: hypothetical protein ACKV2Q_09600 [Planctomycetaceae bacterium]
MTNLWPKLNDLGDSLPFSIVMRQAEALPSITSNIIRADIIPLKSEGGMFRYEFELFVPALDYRFTLFQFIHEVQGYPVTFVPYEKLAEELGCRYTAYGRGVAASNEEEFNQLLGLILGSRTTKGILEVLIAQSRKLTK